MTWKKGQSGNPKGRAVEDSSEIKALARKHCPRAIERLREWMESDNPKASAYAASALLDRGYGKPSQEIEAKGKLDLVAVIVDGKDDK